MDPLRGVANAVHEPYRARAFLKSRLQDLNVRTGASGRKPDGIDVMAEDWDVLVLLDAARYDMTSEEWEGEAPVESRRSKATHSHEFVVRNFAGRELHDTVYLTANPYASKLDGDEFHRLVMIGDYSYWDDDSRIPPERVTDKAIDASKEYPNKRLIVHYMQPHYPYLGPTGRSLPEDRFWQRVRGGDISQEKLRRAYRENLRIALDEAVQINDNVQGKTVISADHGELLGDRGSPIPVPMHIHPHDYYHEKLITVPWIELDADERREVTSEPPRSPVTLSEQEVNDRLAALGYKT